MKSKSKVFLSSTTRDLKEYREAARAAIDLLRDLVPEYMECWSASPEAPLDCIKKQLRDCSVYVGIIGWCYGDSPPGSDKSFTEWEYDLAGEMEIPRLIFLTSEDFPQSPSLIEAETRKQKLQNFRQRVGKEIIFWQFSNPDQLKNGILSAFYNFRLRGGRTDISTDDWETVCRAYLQTIHSHFEELNARYTELRVTSDIRVASYKGERLSKEKKARQMWLTEIFREADDLIDLRSLVILGDPGSGKTTACQRACWLIAGESLKVLDNRQEGIVRIPIYFDLGKFRSDDPAYRDASGYKIVLAFAAKEFQYLLARRQSALLISPENIDCFIRKAPFVFFFDGLNEVGRDHRHALIEAIDDFIKLHHHPESSHQSIITTRKMDYEYEIEPFLPIERYPPMEILEFGDEGLNELIMRDLGNTEGLLQLLNAGVAPQDIVNTLELLITGKSLDPWKAIYQMAAARNAFSGTALQLFDQHISNLRSAQRLVDLLHQPESKRILWMSQNPSTLRDVIDVYRREGQLPRSRIQLLEKAVLARLERQMNRQIRLGQNEPVPLEIKEKAMQSLAFRMTDPAQGLQLPEKTARALIQETLPDEVEEPNAKKVLDDIMFLDELLTERPAGYVSFIKQPYQEYFAVRELRDRYLQQRREGKDPLQDRQIRDFFFNRTHFQTTCGIVGLLPQPEALALVHLLGKQRQSRFLAAMCIRNLEESPSELLNSFLAKTVARIKRFAYLPQDSADLMLTILLIGLVGMASIFSSAYAIFEAFSSAMLFVSRNWLHCSLLITVMAALVGFCSWLARQNRDQDDDSPSLTFHQLDQQLWLISVMALPLPLSMALKTANGYRYISAALALLGVGYLLYRLLIFSSVYVLTALTTRTEEYLVKDHLISHMEILRELGPDAIAAIRQIQQEFQENDTMSPRIRDAAMRTWAVSPKTVFQLLAEIDNPKAQPEAILKLAGFVRRDDISEHDRDRAIEGLFKIARTSVYSGTVHNALAELSRLGQESVGLRSKAVEMIRSILDDTSRKIGIRRHAYRLLLDMGAQDLTYPQPNPEEVRRRRNLWILLLTGLIAPLCLGYFLSRFLAS